MSFFVLKNLGLTNNSFDRMTLNPLGWNGELVGSDWRIPLSQFDNMPSLFLNIEHTSVRATDEEKLRVFEFIKSKEMADLDREMRRNVGNPGQIVQVADAGLNSWLSAIKLEILMNEIDGIRSTYFEMIGKLYESFWVREVISYSLNVEEVQRIISIIKLGYLFQISTNIEEIQSAVSKSVFAGILPYAQDWTSYPHAFLVFNPYIMVIPVSRFTSASIWVPERTMLPHYSSQIGFAQALVQKPTMSVGYGNFQLLGDTNRISRIRARRFTIFILSRMNIFFKYILNPRNSLNGEGQIKYDFCLQQICSAHLLFSDFSILSTSTDSVSRLNYFLSIVDKLANFKVQYRESILSERIENRNGAEKEAFDKIVSEAGMEEALSIVLHHLDSVDSGLMREFRASLRSEIDMLLNFSPHHDFQETMRILRNLRHGSFLMRDQFFRLFGEAQVQLPVGFISLAYLYMLAFILDTKKFLRF